jgi:hypothetical protein
MVPKGNLWLYPPPPPDLWNHRLTAKFEFNLWAAMTYGQNLETKGFKVQGLQGFKVWDERCPLQSIGISKSLGFHSGLEFRFTSYCFKPQNEAPIGLWVRGGSPHIAASLLFQN